MYRFIDFNDERADTFLLLELTDLAKTLTKSRMYEVKIQVHSYLSKNSHTIFVSHFWNHRPERVKKAGMKSDLYLRAVGNNQYTDFIHVEEYAKKVESTAIPSFAKQLLMLAEDIRVEELCKEDRPGTVSEFQVRRETYLTYFESQLKVNLEKNLHIDALYCLIYLLWNAEKLYVSLPYLNEEIDRIVPMLRTQLEKIFEVQSTKDCVDLCLNIVDLLSNAVQLDMINDYFHLPKIEQNMLVHPTFSDLLRKDPLQNKDVAEKKSEGVEQKNEEEMKTWHRETDKPGENFLQFELEQGTQTDLSGGNEREGEDGDQALAIVQGHSQETHRKDYRELDFLSEDAVDSEGATNIYGTANKGALPFFLKALPSTIEDKMDYTRLAKDIRFYEKKLKNIIERMLEKKQSERRTQLQMGRLDKNLLPFFTDEHPKIFYKKADPARAIDAAFSLLIDCSASMFDKMEETKKGIILFHEALKSVHVQHEVTGFWEDGNEATSDEQPNFFFQAIPFSTSMNMRSGPEIMQLEAKEDNRDGFAIRIMTERLLERTEKQKFLIIFSDGEPAACNYDGNGIVDTHEAVIEARKKGIEVFNVFLSNVGLEPEQKKVFENIYGNRSIIAPYVEELPDILFPLLKKLLNQSINM